MRAKAYLYLTIAVGLTILALGIHQWTSADPLRFACYLALALVASGLKVRLPEITGTLSVNFLFVLIGIVELSLPETLVLGCGAALLQCLWKASKRPRADQLLFNVACMATAITATAGVYHSLRVTSSMKWFPLALGMAAIVYFATNTGQVSVIVSLTEGKRVWKVWHECYFWSFPFYLVGAAFAGLISIVNHSFGWESSLLVLPVAYWVYRTYYVYLARLEDEKKHAEEVAGLHLRTLEALALAIEAKDQTTHDHLQRLPIYAVEIGKEMGLNGNELEALRAAALLHDVGKLAVPEHIIAKPGRLTPEEFEKMKVHPVVGAEILERVKFPYAVAPIVRAHHERWDGSGYPDGLKEGEIPLGARILAAVDCLEALTTDRQYRRALPLTEAMAIVRSQSGRAFDPQVVTVLERRYLDLDRLARAVNRNEPKRLSNGAKVERGLAPAAGFEPASMEKPAGASIDFLASIAGARSEAQMLFELSQTLGNSLSLDETLSVLAIRLRHLIPYDAIAIYVRKGDCLIPEYVSGGNFRQLSSLRVPWGQGVSGWVAKNRKPIVNGNPAMEPGYSIDPDSFGSLHSALAVPLEGLVGVVGVLTLYHNNSDAFTRDHLRVLMAISSKLGFSIENILKYRVAESSATTDYLTGLPNARSLFLQLDRELARCRRSHAKLALLVCDLDGFKQVNDRYGHLAGNKLLQRMATQLKEACREYDYVARMGGDEFVILLPGLGAEVLDEKLLRFEQIALEVGREICGESLVSMSIGRAVFPTDGDDAEQLLADADHRMYLNKQRHHEQLRTVQECPTDWQTTRVQ
ncbi:MAG: HD domain-containing phosphohydrolase [Candidatus Acidiferrales bacterium]